HIIEPRAFTSLDDHIEWVIVVGAPPILGGDEGSGSLECGSHGSASEGAELFLLRVPARYTIWRAKVGYRRRGPVRHVREAPRHAWRPLPPGCAAPVPQAPRSIRQIRFAKELPWVTIVGVA